MTHAIELRPKTWTKEEIDALPLPPMTPKILAAYTRIWTEPGLLESFDPGANGIWIAFVGEQIVAHGSSLEQVTRAARATGETDENILLVPVPPDNWVGL